MKTHQYLFLKIKSVFLLAIFLTPFSFKLIHQHQGDRLQQKINHIQDIQNTTCDCDLHDFNFKDTLKPDLFEGKLQKQKMTLSFVLDHYQYLPLLLFDYSNHHRGPPMS